MAAFLVHLTVLPSAFYPVPVVQPPADPAAQYYGVAPAQFYGVAPRAEVFMNTKYGDPNVLNNRKKNPLTGSTTVLKGYTVGSRAPRVAKNSGTVNQFGYGIDNLYGGRAAKAPAPKVVSSSRSS